MNVFAVVAVIAIGIFVVAEILTAYQKYQMKKQFLGELDKKGGNYLT
jgi:hypothetical protein